MQYYNLAFQKVASAMIVDENLLVEIAKRKKRRIIFFVSFSCFLSFFLVFLEMVVEMMKLTLFALLISSISAFMPTGITTSIKSAKYVALNAEKSGE